MRSNRSSQPGRRERGRAGQTVRRFRSRAVRAAVLAAPVVALSLSLGTSPVQASERGLPATAVTWHKFALMNGWQSDQSGYGTGDPSWAVKGGVVYLSGSLTRGPGTSGRFATLPSQARPAHTLRITVCTYQDTAGYLFVKPSGAVTVQSSPSSNSTIFTSLAGVSFPSPSLAQKKLTLKNGWQSGRSKSGSGDPSYAVKGGVVYLSGSIDQPAGTATEFAVLPGAARPAATSFDEAFLYNGTFGGITFDTDGTSYSYSGPQARLFTSLDGVSYPAAATTRHKLTLLNGWKQFSSGAPAYTLIGGVVHLSGYMHQPAGTSLKFAVLPPGTRPAHDLYITITANGFPATVKITPNGAMLAYSPVPSNARTFSGLAEVSFPLGS